MSITRSKLLEGLYKSRWLFNLFPEIVTVSSFNPVSGFGEFMESNDRALHFFGYSHDNFYGLPAGDIMVEAKEGKLRCVEQRLYSEKYVIFETVVMTKSGHRAPVEMEACLFHCDEEDLVICFSTDISSRIFEMTGRERVLRELGRFIGTCSVGYESWLENASAAGDKGCRCRFVKHCCRYSMIRGNGQNGETTLTVREREVLDWISKGKNTGDISILLDIKESTVRYHVNRILYKLNAFTRAHAVAIAFQRGML